MEQQTATMASPSRSFSSVTMFAAPSNWMFPPSLMAFLVFWKQANYLKQKSGSKVLLFGDSSRMSLKRIVALGWLTSTMKTDQFLIG